MLINTRVYAKSELKFTDLLRTISEIKSRDVNPDYLQKYNTDVIQYTRVEQPEKLLEFSVKGDLISIWFPGYEHPLRLEFFGEECEHIYEYDEITGKKIKELEFIVYSKYLPADAGEVQELQIVNYDSKLKTNVNEELIKLLFTNKEVKGIESFYNSINFEIVNTDYKFPSLFLSNLKVFEKEIERLDNGNYKVLISTHHEDELPKNLKKYILTSKETEKTFKLESVRIETGDLRNLPAGLISESEKFAFYTDRELFGSVYLSSQKIKSTSSTRLKKLLAQFEGEINLGDFVVHEDYGIGIYSGLKQEAVEGVEQDYLLLKFADDDELYVPLTQIEKITKYLSNTDLPPALTRIGKAQWKVIRDKVKKSTLRLAKELIEHYAKREISKAAKVDEKDSELYEEFVKAFEFTETKDQITAINEVIKDLEAEKPMNRLLVGDVGFGKTEVAMRAAFKIAEHGGQVAVLAPTTILTAQHFAVFKERFKDFPFEIKYMSRFNTIQENRKIANELNEGRIDMVIGTHRLLSSDIKFKNLELLVVDEEQKFGVKQKEKIKEINLGVHVLSVSATPIPRTLSLALASIQDISIITTPPKGRKPIETEIIYNDITKAASAIEFEIKRGGQVYFLHNRVNTIQAIKLKLENLLPGIRFQIAHGQMAPSTLDRIMTDFYLKKFDCLICTTIIESGLDLPNVNTIIINDAHKFGLSQLYQLRGRVGRSEKQAYCYLLAPKPSITPVNILSEGEPSAEAIVAAKKLKEKQNQYLERLNALVQNRELGSGFQIASKDLEIRGAGTILGEKQHGHISAIGYALYIQMLAEEIERLRSTAGLQ